MWTWFVSGGWVMWLLLVVGALAVLACAKFARLPDPKQLARIGELRRALAWGTFVGIASDLAAVGLHINARDDWAHSPDLALLVLQGIAESLSPAMLGGGLLVVTSLLLAAGHGRLNRLGIAP
jgi:hypothetical protein